MSAQLPLPAGHFASPDDPAFIFESLQLEWLMTRWEKYAIDNFLKWLKPKVALEIGTFRGGSLQVIAKYSDHVHSVDLIAEPREMLASRFPNVEFHVGDSSVLVPELVEWFNKSESDLQFVLIDGDHSTDGVRRDIESVLAIRPKSPLYILMHDSFHPPCRQGMLDASWSTCPFVHYVEIDFVPGVYYREGTERIKPASMYGGFGFAKLLPVERDTDLDIGQVQHGLYEACLRDRELVLAEPAQRSVVESKGFLEGFKRALRFRA